MADPSMTGKANFGFVSKYQRGASTGKPVDSRSDTYTVRNSQRMPRQARCGTEGPEFAGSRPLLLIRLFQLAAANPNIFRRAIGPRTIGLVMLKQPDKQETATY
jgi:hypothetical protein